MDYKLHIFLQRGNYLSTFPCLLQVLVEAMLQDTSIYRFQTSITRIEEEKSSDIDQGAIEEI